MSNSERFSSEKYFGLIAKSSLDLIDSQEYSTAVDTLFDCYLKGGVIFTMGCGGSASTASHFAADLAKTTIVRGKPRIKAISLVENVPLVSAWTNDEGWGNVFSGQLEQWLTAKDVLVGFSVHGGSGKGNAGPWSQNLVSAMNLAKERKARIIGFSGFDGGAMNEMADSCIVIGANSETYGTPLVEAMHVVVHHSIIFDLKERITKSK